MTIIEMYGEMISMKDINTDKKLVIIAGATGSIGQELLKHYLLEKNTIVYGISRKGVSLDMFASLPLHNLMVKVDMSNEKSIDNFFSKIPKGFNKIIYCHLLGNFKTEINKDLEVVVENDLDGDGLDDEVYRLVAGAYKDMTNHLNRISLDQGICIDIVSFGSLADRHNIPCFKSFGKSREVVRMFSKEIYEKNNKMNFFLFETSTILAADEMIERPFIFATQVNPVYWITPIELANRAIGFMALEKGFVEKDIFIANPNYSNDYFDANVTYKRRVKELFNISL